MPSPQTSLCNPFTFPPRVELNKLADSRPAPSFPYLPAPDRVIPPLRETVPPPLGWPRRYPKVNFWSRLEFRQAVKLNSRTRKWFNKEGL